MERFGVWTVNNSPEWLAKNANVPKCLIVCVDNAEKAVLVKERLEEVYGDTNVFIQRI
jgi:hypothetical protein